MPRLLPPPPTLPQYKRSPAVYLFKNDPDKKKSGVIIYDLQHRPGCEGGGGGDDELVSVHGDHAQGEGGGEAER